MLFFRRAPAEELTPPPALPVAEVKLPAVVSPGDEMPDDIALLEMLPANVPLPCPICDSPLERDLHWRSSHWLCGHYHSYSNVRALLAELRETGKMPKGMAGAAPKPAAEAADAPPAPVAAAAEPVPEPPG